MSAAVSELALDLEAFEGPFDLLLTLVLKEELELADVEVAAIVLAFLKHVAARSEPDLEACGEFLVLVSALLELKARGLFPDEELDFDELDPDEAAEELAERLAAYRRFKSAAAWLEERLESEQDRHLTLTFPPLGLFLERFRAVLKRRALFVFDREVDGLSRIEQAVAFLALLELRKGGEVSIAQDAPFEPITVKAA